MKNASRYIAFLLTGLFFTLVYTDLDFDNSSAFPYILNFLSIATGFTITALSIIATSSFSKKLHMIESKSNNSLTLLHLLVFKFRRSVVVFMLTIFLILVFEFIPKGEILNIGCGLTISSMLKGMIWYFTIVSWIIFLSLFLTFVKFIIKCVTTE